MKCAYCGFECEEDFAFCTQCGKAVLSEEAVADVTENEAMPEAVVSDLTTETAVVDPVYENPLPGNVLSALKDPLFLVISILVTVAAGLGFLGGSLPVLPILACIFLWIIYNRAHSDDLRVDNVRWISGVLFADYVMSYVGAAILALFGVFSGVMIEVVANSTDLLNEIVNAFEIVDAEYMDLIEIILSTSGLLIFAIFAVFAVVAFLLNFLGMRKIHAFVKSVYQSLQNGNVALHYVEAAKTWLLVFGIFQCLSVLTSFSNGCLGVAMILASVLIGRYFVEK